MEIYNTYIKQKDVGFALIMALIVSSVVLSVGLSMLSITIKQVDLTATARESETAFQVASAALDCALMTRIREDQNIATTSPAGSIRFDCGDINSQLTTNQSGGTNYAVWQLDEDWEDATADERWMSVQMYVVDATGGEEVFNPPGRDFSATCSAGIFCTYIFAQGYNRSQTEIQNGASFAVQRELTAEF